MHAELLAELNATHVWNYAIEAHARFHIVWQLSSNCLYGVMGLLLLWGFLDRLFRPEEVPTLLLKVRLVALLLLLEPAGFVLAAASRTAYGGTFFPANVPEYDISIFGIIPVALFVFLVLAAVEVVVLCVTVDLKRGKS